MDDLFSMAAAPALVPASAAVSHGRSHGSSPTPSGGLMGGGDLMGGGGGSSNAAASVARAAMGGASRPSQEVDPFAPEKRKQLQAARLAREEAAVAAKVQQYCQSAPLVAPELPPCASWWRAWRL